MITEPLNYGISLSISLHSQPNLLKAVKDQVVVLQRMIILSLLDGEMGLSDAMKLLEEYYGKSQMLIEAL